MTRRSGLVILAAAVVIAVVAGGWLGFRLATASDSLGCPTALMQGTLVEHEGTLAIANPEPGGEAPGEVDWPFGYAVERRDGELVLTRMFMVVAREGEVVGMGGGYTNDDDRFDACGPVTLGWMIPPEPAPEPKSTFIVMATAAVPCIPPPSGCGYTVTLVGPDGAVSEARFEDNRSYDDVVEGIKAALRLSPGLPTALAPGTYDLGFEIAAYSDEVDFDADGNELGPERWTGCAARLTVPELAGDHVVTVRVAFDDQACAIEPTQFVEASAP